MTEARCMKCKEQITMVEEEDTIIRGKCVLKAKKGKCHKCGTKVFRILGKL